MSGGWQRLATMMKVLLLMLASAATAVAWQVPMATSKFAHPTTRSAVTSMGFEDSLQDMIDGVSTFFAKTTNKPAVPPTAAEIEEYCRDPESSGCSVEMMDMLMAEAEKLNKVSTPTTAVRWSPEIDAAVFKCD